MGLADCLIKQEITYGSKESLKFIDKMGKVLINSALQESASLAATLGTYPKYNEKVLDTDFFKYNANEDTVKLVTHFGLRNSQLLTTAPTGSISTMIGVSGGLEPIFANYYTRTTKSLHNKDEVYKVYTPIVKKYMEDNGIDDDKYLPEFFIVSEQIKPIDRVKVQGTIQKHIDASISSTVNLPQSATLEDVATIYMEAWKNGLKGITVFRSGCKRVAILNTDTSSSNSGGDIEAVVSSVEDVGKSGYTAIKWGTVLPVRTDLDGMKTRIFNGCGDFHFQLFFDENTGRPWETFINMGSNGGCERNLENISKFISKCLRAGVDIYDVIETLKQTRPCPSYMSKKLKGGQVSQGTSCPSAMGFALENFMQKIKVKTEANKDKCPMSELTESLESLKAEANKNNTEKAKIEKVKCPECGEELTLEGGCSICHSCGYSKCD